MTIDKINPSSVVWRKGNDVMGEAFVTPNGRVAIIKCPACNQVNKEMFVLREECGWCSFKVNHNDEKSKGDPEAVPAVQVLQETSNKEEGAGEDRPFDL